METEPMTPSEAPNVWRYLWLICGIVQVLNCIFYHLEKIAMKTPMTTSSPPLGLLYFVTACYAFDKWRAKK